MEIKNRTQGSIGGLLPSPKRVVRRPQHLEADEPDPLLPPVRRGFQAIPTPEVLQKLIDRALSALQSGMFWDRGSILNLLV